MSVETIIERPEWADADFESLAQKAAEAALAACGLDDADAALTILAVDDARVAELNAQYRNKDAATNVLSWPTQELASHVAGEQPSPPQADVFGDTDLGDIALAFETCAREADEQGKSMADHVTHLIVHGVLHLLGYDHVRDQDATVMEALEVEILGKLGLPDPYS